MSLMVNWTREEETEGWLTKEEAARYLRIHPDTLRVRANKGDIKRYGSGKMQRYRRSDLDQYLEGHP